MILIDPRLDVIGHNGAKLIPIDPVNVIIKAVSPVDGHIEQPVRIERGEYPVSL